MHNRNITDDEICKNFIRFVKESRRREKKEKNTKNEREIMQKRSLQFRIGRDGYREWELAQSLRSIRLLSVRESAEHFQGDIITELKSLRLLSHRAIQRNWSKQKRFTSITVTHQLAGGYTTESSLIHRYVDYFPDYTYTIRLVRESLRYVWG